MVTAINFMQCTCIIVGTRRDGLSLSGSVILAREGGVFWRQQLIGGAASIKEKKRLLNLVNKVHNVMHMYVAHSNRERRRVPDNL